MLRLWPDEIQIGLFTDRSWIRLPSGEVREYPAASGGDHHPSSLDSAPFLDLLAHVLDDPANRLRRGTRVAISMTDTKAEIVALPWQDALSGRAELRRYADLLFEQHGRAVGSDWPVRAEFSAHRGAGLAYAIAPDLLEKMAAAVGSRACSLRRVLPASAAAFYSDLGRGRGRRLVILQEAGRVSALTFSGRRFETIDLEPVTLEKKQALIRLLRRVNASQHTLAAVSYWTSNSDNTVAIGALLQGEFPGATHRSIPRESLR